MNRLPINWIKRSEQEPPLDGSIEIITADIFGDEWYYNVGFYDVNQKCIVDNIECLPIEFSHWNYINPPNEELVLSQEETDLHEAEVILNVQYFLGGYGYSYTPLRKKGDWVCLGNKIIMGGSSMITPIQLLYDERLQVEQALKE